MKITPKHIFLTLFFIFILPYTANASFTDVPSAHRQYEAITSLENQGILRGYSDNTFRPDEYINRAAFLKVVFAGIGFSPDSGNHETIFSDVPEDSWFSPYFKIAYDLNLIKYSPGEPKAYPTQPIINIEGLKAILPVYGIPAPLMDDVTSLPYGDVNAEAPYSYLIKAAHNAGIHLDKYGQMYRPFEKLTRGDTAELVYKAQQYADTDGAPAITLNLSGSGFEYDEDFLVFFDVWDKINYEYINLDEIDKTVLIQTAIDGMIDALNDTYSDYYPTDEANEAQNYLQGDFEGIGIVLDTFEDEFIIMEVFPSSPALEAGLKSGDIITHVDREDVSDFDMATLVEKIRGPEGTTVSITVKRDTGSRTYTVSRKALHIDSVYLNDAVIPIPGDIAYISIYQFTDTTDAEFRVIVDKEVTSGIKGIILDLRNNPGGFVQSAFDIAEHFLKDNDVIAHYQIGPEIYTQRAFISIPDLSDMPLVVLVNGNSASAAEILAAALQENKGVKLIGEQTFGKATVQELTLYTDGSILKLSIAKWLTPNKKDIDGIGIRPDISMAKSQSDITGTTDSQLSQAITELQKIY
jgi:carboxyl-terminal processing protease